MSVSNKEQNSEESSLFNSKKSLSSLSSHISTPTSTPKSKRTQKDTQLLNSMISLQESQTQVHPSLSSLKKPEVIPKLHSTPPSPQHSLSSLSRHSSLSPPPSLQPCPSVSSQPAAPSIPSFLSILNISPSSYRKTKLAIKYAPIRNLLVENNQELSHCCICLDDSPYEDDKIVICELCYSSVHQKCYGKELSKRVPDKEWFCERCIHLQQYSLEAEHINCLLCPDLEGIIIRWNGDEEIWVHPMCVDWMKELSYADEECRKIVGRVNQMRFELKCYICKVHRGACIQCNYTGCTRSFHVCCAVREGLIKKDMEEYKVEEEYNCFCKYHVAKGLEEIKAHGKILTKTKREFMAKQIKCEKEEIDGVKQKKRGRKRKRNDD